MRVTLFLARMFQLHTLFQTEAINDIYQRMILEHGTWEKALYSYVVFLNDVWINAWGHVQRLRGETDRMYIMGDRAHGESRNDDSTPQQPRGSRDQDTKYLEDNEIQLKNATVYCMAAIANYLDVGDRHQHHVMHILLRLLLEHFSADYKEHINRINVRHYYAIFTHFISQINIPEEPINDIVINIVSRCLITYPHQAYWLAMSMFDDSLRSMSHEQQSSLLSPSGSLGGETAEQRREREHFERCVSRIRDIVHTTFIGQPQLVRRKQTIDSKIATGSSLRHHQQQQTTSIPQLPPNPPTLPSIRPIKLQGGMNFFQAVEIPAPPSQCLRIHNIVHPWTVAHTARNVINQLCGG
jgi:hypothetical protein